MTSASRLKVVVVDDSLLYRKIVRDALSTLPNVEVVGSAGNGKLAVEQIERLQPDLVTLDFEMPEMDGLGVLRWLREKRLRTKAVMLSALTSEGAESTIRALQEGAFDFVCKPNGGDQKQNLQELTTALQHRIDTISFLLGAAMGSGGTATSGMATRRAAAAAGSPTNPATEAAKSNKTPIHKKILPGSRKIQVVGIGVSTGGPDALRSMVPSLPADFPVPIVLVQHMPPVFTKSLANSLDKICPLNVYEAEAGRVIRPGEIAIAPGGKQMKVVRNAIGYPEVVLTDDPPVQSCRPSVDYLFDSLAEQFGANTLSVIMTGMGYDGADSSRRLHELGGPVIVQNEATCVVFGMPRKPVEEGYADVVAPLDQIANEIGRYVGRRSSP